MQLPREPDPRSSPRRSPRAHRGVAGAALAAWLAFFPQPWDASGQRVEPPTALPASAVFRTGAGDGGLEGAADRLAMALMAARSPEQAWRAMAGAGPGTLLVMGPSPRAVRGGGGDLAEAIRDRLKRHAPKGMSVKLWRGATRREDFDAKAGFDLPVAGRLIWGDLLFGRKEELSTRSHWAKAVTGASRIVNVAPMRASESCGVAGAIYNATLPHLDNWRRIIAPPGRGDPYLPEAFIRDELYPKLVAHFLDGAWVQFAGEAESEPNYRVEHGLHYASKDPLALDGLILGMIGPLRKAANLPAVDPLSTYLDAAQSMGVGVLDPARVVLTDLPR